MKCRRLEIYNVTQRVKSVRPFSQERSRLLKRLIALGSQIKVSLSWKTFFGVHLVKIFCPLLGRSAYGGKKTT